MNGGASELIQLDRRTRCAADRRSFSRDEVLDDVLPALCSGPNGALAARGLRALDLPPLALRVDGGTLTLSARGDRLVLEPGEAEGAALVSASEYALSRMLTDQTSPAVLQLEGEVRVERGAPAIWGRFEPVFQALVNGWPVYEPGGISLTARDGSPLEVGHVFPSDAPNEDMAHFLAEAGFLHVRGVFTREEATALDRAIDEVLARVRPGDPGCGTAKTSTGERVVVGLQEFADQWPRAREYLAKPEFLRLGALVDGGARIPPRAGNVQHKALDIVEGLAITPWHRDCGPGQHSYKCCVVRAGIAVTKDSEESGLFGVIPGSHRANVSNDPRTLPPELERRMVYCEPGDVHIHLSCTFHRGTPPKSVSRRVFYSDFLLPPRPGDSDEEVSPYRAGDGRVGAVGRGVAAAARAQSDDV